ncbi:MAG: type II toxin-antitoxin system HicB family antitoxin [Candidatus Sungbacteria bacterium]|nr:type II toxin-antitoxin system HicB family antitoxin [Candidatus Sungbacteria bacterium]
MKNKREFTIQTRNGTYKVLIWRDAKEGVYLVKGISLPEVATFGKTLTEAKKMAKDAIEIYCDCVIEDGKIVVDETRKAVGRLPKSRLFAPVP